jgi:hypothetical protein
MNTPIAVVPALLAAGCSASGALPGRSLTPPAPSALLAAAPLDGPYESRDAACAELGKRATGAFGWKATTCAEAAIELGGVSLGASVLRMEDTSPSDPRTRGSGAFFLGIRAGSGWFVVPAPLDVINGGAGHTFVPRVLPACAEAVLQPGGELRALLRLVDTTDAICNVCEGPEREARRRVRTEHLVIACALAGSKPECTPPLHVEPATTVSLGADDVLTVALARWPGEALPDQGAAPQRYRVTF